MRYANLLLILFLCAISFASESAPLRFAAAEMPKPDPCLPFITETYKWVEKHWPDVATFRYYDVTSLEKAVQNREIDIVPVSYTHLIAASTPAALAPELGRPFQTADNDFGAVLPRLAASLPEVLLTLNTDAARLDVYKRQGAPCTKVRPLESA